MTGCNENPLTNLENVDNVDLLRILDTFGQSGELPEDLNRDGVVDDQDLLTVLFSFGRGCGKSRRERRSHRR
jgi:hypothetical protein